MPTILVVDDDPGVRFALTEVLRDRGYRVVDACTGAQAIARLAGVDVVITDLVMPGMDGLELIGRILRIDPRLPVILLTAHGSEHLARAAVGVGALGCLAKPFDIDEVVRAVDRACGAQRPGLAGGGGAS